MNCPFLFFPSSSYSICRPRDRSSPRRHPTPAMAAPPHPGTGRARPWQAFPGRGKLLPPAGATPPQAAASLPRPRRAFPSRGELLPRQLQRGRVRLTPPPPDLTNLRPGSAAQPCPRRRPPGPVPPVRPRHWLSCPPRTSWAPAAGCLRHTHLPRMPSLCRAGGNSQRRKKKCFFSI